MSRTLTLLLALSAAAVAADGPAFDVASVKVRSIETMYTGCQITGVPGAGTSGRFRGPCMALSNMLAMAFGVAPDQIRGPKWITDNSAMAFYEVDATMPPTTTQAEFQKMLQNLLVDRFHLKYHVEKRDFPGYELVVDDGGPKIKEVTPDPSPDKRDGVSPTANRERGSDGFPVVRGPQRYSIIEASGRNRSKYQEISMEDFVSNLGYSIGSSQGSSVLDGNLQPRVMDKTGLKGKYTFILEYFNASATRLRSQASIPAVAASDAVAPVSGDVYDGMDIITAIRKQLGLKLNKAAAVPQDVIVVDSIEKTPTAN